MRWFAMCTTYPGPLPHSPAAMSRLLPHLRHPRRRTPLAVVSAALVLAACAGDSGVTATQAAKPAPAYDRDTPLEAVDRLPDVDPVDWQPCDDQPEPWECGTVVVPLDYRRPWYGDPVEIAVTRLPATGERIGSLVLNPGGPGASGVGLAWGAASSFPDSLLQRFDIVGFDPRGVDRSTPVRCSGGGGDGCVANSGAILPYLGTPNVARDLEQVRKAIGDEQLTYLGFSYGTALGAVYADMFPESVRALVLDGSVDPAAGRYNVDGTAAGNFGSPFYGPQDFDSTRELFFDLCDATNLCVAGPDSRATLREARGRMDEATTDFFGLDDDSPVDADGLVSGAMYDADTWPAVAVGLRDAARGDASTLAALQSFFEAGYPRDDHPFDIEAANTAIYCADFAGREGDDAVPRCKGWPDSAEPLPPITEVDVANPILVIGTDGDPATPGYLAPKMADALGDAVDIRWRGAGHTAFGHSECIDGLVVDYLVDLTVPEDGTTCGFSGERDTTVANAEYVFSLDGPAIQKRLTEVFTTEGLDPDVAACVAEGIVAEDSVPLVVYARLGVQRPEYVSRRRKLESDCGG